MKRKQRPFGCCFFFDHRQGLGMTLLDSINGRAEYSLGCAFEGVSLSLSDFHEDGAGFQKDLFFRLCLPFIEVIHNGSH